MSAVFVKSRFSVASQALVSVTTVVKLKEPSLMYCKVTSRSTSRLDAHPRILDCLLMGNLMLMHEILGKKSTSYQLCSLKFHNWGHTNFGTAFHVFSQKAEHDDKSLNGCPCNLGLWEGQKLICFSELVTDCDTLLFHTANFTFIKIDNLQVFSYKNHL